MKPCLCVCVCVCMCVHVQFDDRLSGSECWLLTPYACSSNDDTSAPADQALFRSIERPCACE